MLKKKKNNVTQLIYTGRRRREPANIQNTFNQINKHNRKAAAPHGRLPHTKHKLKSRPGPLSSSNVVTPPFIPSEAPPWDSRPVSGAGVVHYHSLHRPRSVPTALGPAPLVTYPHRPSQAGGYSRDCALLPPSPLSRGEPVRAAAAYLGVRTDEARERRRKDEEWQRRERGERRKKKSRSGSRTHCRSVLNQLSGSLAVPCDGTGPLWWTARCSSASWRTAVAPPVEGSRQRVPRSLLLPKHGGWQQASASRRTGRLLRSLSDGSHPSSTQEHGSESSVPPVLLLLQHHRFGQPLAVSATSYCPISSAPRSPSAARALWQRVPPSSRVSAPM